MIDDTRLMASRLPEGQDSGIWLLHLQDSISWQRTMAAACLVLPSLAVWFE
jgi:hypothetical protein